MIKHISVRVAWHDNQWNGTVCCKPNSNGYCTQLPRIYEEKKDDEVANKDWSSMDPQKLPPCKAEGGAFMNNKSYRRSFNHPYQEYNKANHSHLQRTEFEVPPFSVFSVPFWWMLNKNQKEINSEYPGLPFNQFPKTFSSPWVYDELRQKSILDLFFNPIVKNKSLITFYTKSGNPIDEDCRRLLIGIGTVTDKSAILSYNKSTHGPDYPLWDRRISHSIQPIGQPGDDKGFLIPYHQYIALEEKQYKIDGILKTKEDLISEIKVSLIDTGDDENRISDFSYGSEWVTNRNMLAVITKLRKVVEVIKKHGIIEGPWDERIQWLSRQIGQLKKNMGPFPSFSSALVAFGFKPGHLLAYDLYNEKICDTKDNPWDYFEDALYGDIRELKNKSYSKEFDQIKILWESLATRDKELLILLSRFELNVSQITRWFDETKRRANGYRVSTQELLGNPYLLVENDEPKNHEKRITVETIDYGVFEDRSVQGEYVPEKPMRLESKIDPRRIRALVISILKERSNEGDTLLSLAEIKERLDSLSINEEVEVPANYLATHIEYLKEKLVHISTDSVNALQLKIYHTIETELSKKFLARASRNLSSLNEDWADLIKTTINKSGNIFNPEEKRHVDALKDQSSALETITTRKLSILNGPAGTGKTSVMGALFESKSLTDRGILLLAPTGKARAKLEKMTGHTAFTIAQFLTKQKRFDWSRMKTLFHGKEKYKAEKTLIIDECSMLTEDNFYALFQAFDLMHLDRVILVGDPFQLPPIGAGRPFADLCAFLEGPFKNEEFDRINASKALAKLEVVVRTKNDGADSDTLKLASWFAGRKSGKNSDVIFDKLGSNELLNDLRIELWEDPEDLKELINKTIKEEFNLKDEMLIEGFNRLLGASNGKFSIDNPELVEQFQMLTPVRSPLWGANNLNRLVQSEYRERPTEPWQTTLGDQNIWQGDKVIQIRNEKRKAYKNGKEFEVQLSNGQIGYMVGFNKSFGNAVFSGLVGSTVGYNSRDFKEDGSKIELAYAITVHKSQGSDFNIVFLVLPKTGRILSRELLYTALTRSKEKLVLLAEGTDISWLFNYSKAEASETARRNTHLFATNIRESKSSIPFVQNLIHKTKQGIYVRSKSEVIIANLLHDAEIEFYYERRFETETGWRLPDFSIPTSSDDLIILEHLGMLHKPSYRDDWEKKKAFYEKNNYFLDDNLFITTEDDNGAIDSEKINDEIISKIKDIC
jgi:ATP-dependent exoDNAse (exonuclease V) alpha subunit